MVTTQTNENLKSHSKSMKFRKSKKKTTSSNNKSSTYNKNPVDSKKLKILIKIINLLLLLFNIKVTAKTLFRTSNLKKKPGNCLSIWKC